jgi:hypothetical protein
MVLDILGAVVCTTLVAAAICLAIHVTVRGPDRQRWGTAADVLAGVGAAACTVGAAWLREPLAAALLGVLAVVLLARAGRR